MDENFVVLFNLSQVSSSLHYIEDVLLILVSDVISSPGDFF